VVYYAATSYSTDCGFLLPRSNAALFAAVLALLIAVPTSLGAVQASAAPHLAPSTDLSLALPAGSGEQNPLPLGTGVDGYYDVELRNLGPSASNGQLTLTLPSGLELGPDGVALYANTSAFNTGTSTTLTCSGVTGTVTCDAGSVGITKVSSDPEMVEIDVLASTGSTSGSSVGEPGTSAQFSVAIAPTSASDPNAANNSVSSTIDFTGVADLTYSITPVAPEVGVGRSTTLTLSVTNHGPQVAGNAFGVAAVDPNGHFSIASFDGPTGPPASTFTAKSARKSMLKNLARSGQNAEVRSAARAMAADAAVPGAVLWFIGDLASGATATSHLVLTAKTTGNSQVALFAGSDAADTGCVGAGDPCTPALDALSATPQTSAAYIASSRVKSAVYINGLVKQYTPAGIVRSAGRTAYLQRYLNGTWQNVLSRKTDTKGQMAVGFIQTKPYVYRLYVSASTTAAMVTSGATIR
jgi:hypothetical protein